MCPTKSLAENKNILVLNQILILRKSRKAKHLLSYELSVDSYLYNLTYKLEK